MKKKYDYKQVLAIRNNHKKRILKLLPEIENKSGIYVYHKIDENGFKGVYVGQAVKLIDRLIDHFMEYDHIALSLKKHKLISEKEYGWDIMYTYCNESSLDNLEKYILEIWHIDKGYAPYNQNTGGTDGKKDIKPRTVGGYRKGVDFGYEKARKEVSLMFKYLKFSKIKDGKINERMYEKFNNFLIKEDLKWHTNN